MIHEIIIPIRLVCLLCPYQLSLHIPEALPLPGVQNLFHIIINGQEFKIKNIMCVISLKKGFN